MNWSWNLASLLVHLVGQDGRWLSNADIAACFIGSSLNNLLTLSRLAVIRYCEYMMNQYVIKNVKKTLHRLVLWTKTMTGFPLIAFPKPTFMCHPNLSDKLKFINTGTVLVLVFQYDHPNAKNYNLIFFLSKLWLTTKIYRITN